MEIFRFMIELSPQKMHEVYQVKTGNGNPSDYVGYTILSCDVVFTENANPLLFKCFHSCLDMWRYKCKL